MRSDGRNASELRRVKISTDFIRHAEGSALIEIGETRVICTATVEEQVPAFLRDTNRGWVTAEYGMLPGSSTSRIQRESARGRVGGRTHEIQRLIGRSVRAVTNLELVGPRTIWLGVWSENFKAQRFYAKHGFEVVATVDNHPHGHRNLLLRKHLT